MSTIDRSEAAQIAQLCAECGVPHMAAGFLGEGLSLDAVKTRISPVGTANEIVALARTKEPSIPADLAATMLAAGLSIDAMRAEVFGRIVAVEEAVDEINSHVPPPMSEGQTQVQATRASMVAEMRKIGLEPKVGWDR